MYKIEIEIYEGKGGELKKDEMGIIYPDVVREGICAWMYRGDGNKSFRQGQRFTYPDDWGKICPWLASSLDPIIQTLRNGGTLGWQYSGTPYEKEINPDGITTEFVRCVDPTESGIVVKVIRTKLPENR